MKQQHPTPARASIGACVLTKAFATIVLAIGDAAQDRRERLDRARRARIVGALLLSEQGSAADRLRVCDRAESRQRSQAASEPARPRGENRIPYIVNQVNLKCGSTAHLAERDPLVAFSNNFFTYGIRMAVKKKSGIRDYDDLAGKTVVTTAGTSDERLLRQLSLQRKLNLRIVSARDHAQAFDALKHDRAMAFVMDDPLLYGKIAEQGAASGEYTVTGASLANETYACMMRKGDPAFKRIVDDVIAHMQRSGEAAKLYDQWFMQPIPPDGINLCFPMSAEMKVLFAQPNDRGSD